MSTTPRSLSSVTWRATAALCLTGVLAGLGVRGAFVGYQIGLLGELAAQAAALASPVACLWLLYLNWQPLAELGGSSPRQVRAMTAVVLTAGLLVLTTPLVIVLALEPYERVFCADRRESFCGLDVILLVPTYLAVVPWTLAGLPSLAGLVFAARKRQSRSR
ncbi:hypothetical protein [Luteipulveratus mongoliensis]|uniref:Uncharacterized protein n=1 Tax=Luteipulveratus mongoliensis TaxID=571913 RepID=A0A0K1JNY8_9MICO|nr:hypothetical protein [Luteipulveratus mongoliensis]AKU18432.1 hypothetical protein VV02_25565 [Luteipulveratus mongoliensis]